MTHSPWHASPHRPHPSSSPSIPRASLVAAAAVPGEAPSPCPKPASNACRGGGGAGAGDDKPSCARLSKFATSECLMTAELGDDGNCGTMSVDAVAVVDAHLRVRAARARATALAGTPGKPRQGQSRAPKLARGEALRRVLAGPGVRLSIVGPMTSTKCGGKLLTDKPADALSGGRWANRFELSLLSSPESRGVCEGPRAAGGS